MNSGTRGAVPAAELMTYTHIWNWHPRMGERNRKGLRCRILVRGGRNSALVEMEDGEWVVCSRNCLRRAG